MIPPQAIYQVADELEKYRGNANVVTLCTTLRASNELTNPNIVKVVRDQQGYAIYFSRSAIPYHRDRNDETNLEHYRRHIGLYAYTVDFLQCYVNWQASPLEQIEKLEQLRILWHREKIYVADATHVSPQDVNNQEDLQVVRALCSRTSSIG